jgi:hypothetical protein
MDTEPETLPRKKSEGSIKKPRSNIPREKGILEKNISSPNMMTKIDKDHPRIIPTLEKNISSPNIRTNIIPKVENLKKSNPSPSKTKGGGKKDHAKSKTMEVKKKEHEYSLSVTLPSLRHSLDIISRLFLK